MSAPRFTWSRQPSERGLAGVCQGPRGFILKRGGKEVGRVSPLTGGPINRDITGWYWYGSGHNSLWSGDKYTNPDDAKAACLAYVRSKTPTPTET
jgi:hypothetical protein